MVISVGTLVTVTVALAVNCNVSGSIPAYPAPGVDTSVSV